MKLIKLLCMVLSFTAALADCGDASKEENLSFMDTIPDVIFTGESEGSYFSVGLGASGDLNGDGYADIVIGAPNHNNFRGRVYIHLGGKDISSVPDMILTGETDETRLGQRVALGDVNNDGYDDLLTGGWGYKFRQGRAYLYYGGKNFDGTCDKVFEAETGTKSGFGFEVALGDVNNDGYADLAIYADAYNSEQGRVYLYYGASGKEMDTTPDKIFDGEQPHSKFGRYLIIGKDVDGDGYGDLLVGAPLWNGERGRAYLYYGGPDTSMDTTADLIFTGEQAGDRFARDIGLGDINGDGRADIVIGAARYKVGQGRVYIYYGDTNRANIGSCDLTITGEPSPNRADFGIGVVVADVNGDEYNDLLIGGDDYPDSKYRGRVYLYYNNGGPRFDVTPDLIFTGETTRINFGRFMDVGDVDNDGYNDIVIGAWSYPNKACKGRAYLYYGGPKKQ